MRKRHSKTIPVKNVRKVVLIVMAVAAGGVALYLFIVGLLSIFSLVPEINVSPETEVVEAVVETASAAKLSELALSKNIRFESIAESSKSAIIIARVKDGPEVYFSKSKESKFQMDSLQIILSKLTIDNKKPSLIDMRYTRPIVKF